MSEEWDGVRKTGKLLLFFGAIFLLIAVVTRAYIYGAEKEAERLQSSNIQFLRTLLEVQNPTSNADDIRNHLDTKKEWKDSLHLVVTIPSGADINSKHSPFSAKGFSSPPRTPTLISKPELPINLATPFRQGVLSNLDETVELTFNTEYLILVNLLWPGLFMILLALFQSRRQETENPTLARPSSSESGSITRVVDPPQPRQVSQIFSLVEGPYQHDPATPEQLIYGRFIQGEIIGKGGMGTVYRCQSCVRGDKGRYALKVLLPEWSTSPDFRARFEREADICHKLTHRNLVRVHERGEKDGDLWMVMDFVQGSEWNQWLQKQTPSHDKIIALFLQICDGLSHAHKQDIVHRDLKPENILVTEDGRKAVIADFGLAKGKHYATITKTNTTLGTPIYMPPEQIQGIPGGPRGDLYSLGCILYESLSGQIPFPGNDVLALLNSKLTGKSPPALTAEQATPELRSIVEKLMAHKPEDRFQSAEELKQSLSLLSRESNSSGA